MGVFLPLALDIVHVKYERLKTETKHSLDHGKTWLPCGVVEEGT